MPHRATLLGVAASMLLVPFVALAQGGTGSGGERIDLDVAVTSKNGQPVTGLTQGDFTVLDNKTAQAVQGFRPLGGRDAPVSVTLVVDAINLSYMQLSYERQQLDTFLSANGGHLAEPTNIAVMTDTASQIGPGYTTDGNALRKALDSNNIGLRELRRSSGFWGADERLQISLTTLQRLIGQQSSLPGHKLLVFISPGWPLLSGPAIQLTGSQEQHIFNQVVAISTQLRQAHITIDAVNPIGTGADPGRLLYYEEYLKPVRKPSQTALANLGLQVIATNSGGVVLNGSNDITGMIRRCADSAKGMYEILYTAPPSEGPNEFHQVQVKVNRPGVEARTSAGYYAQAQFDGNAAPVPAVTPVHK